jgi:hypothetical protein
MGVPSQCTAIKAMSKSAYSSKLNTQKETTVFCVCKEGVAMWSVLWTNTNELTYEMLGIRPLLIDKLSNYCIPKDGVLLPRMDSYSSVLPLIVDPFIIR